MSLFDTLKERATDLAQSGAAKGKELAEIGMAKGKELAEMGVAKSKELAEIGKLKLDNAAEEDAIRKAYIEIGKLYYAERGMTPEPAYVALCEKVTASKAIIEANNARVAEIRAESGEDFEEFEAFETVEEAEEEKEEFPQQAEIELKLSDEDESAE